MNTRPIQPGGTTLTVIVVPGRSLRFDRRDVRSSVPFAAQDFALAAQCAVFFTTMVLVENGQPRPRQATVTGAPSGAPFTVSASTFVLKAPETKLQRMYAATVPRGWTWSVAGGEEEPAKLPSPAYVAEIECDAIVE